jgi:beta-glucanase (GH16 family)
MRHFQLEGHADSFLPEGKNWRMVWHDEFDGPELDESKWGFRRNFWGKPFPAFCGREGIELDGAGNIRLHLRRDGDHFSSPHLQTGSLSYDIPRDTKGFWPFGEYERPKFLHRYGFFEIRCRLPKCPGWHAAFWLQSPSVGAHPDPRRAGIECDIMESYLRHAKGEILCGNIWGGYGKNCTVPGHTHFPHKETGDGYHHYAVDWSPAGYVFYADGLEVKRVDGPVSEVEQFILVSTEPHGYRGSGANFNEVPGQPSPGEVPDPLLFKADLPDYFEVDFVRVFDEC